MPTSASEATALWRSTNVLLLLLLLLLHNHQQTYQKFFEQNFSPTFVSALMTALSCISVSTSTAAKIFGSGVIVAIFH